MLLSQQGRDPRGVDASKNLVCSEVKTWHYSTVATVANRWTLPE